MSTEETDWSSAARLCQNLLDDIDEVTRRAVHRIRIEIPEYAQVPVTEHQEMFRGQARAILLALSMRRAPAPAAMAEVRTLARRRASQGLPLHAVISSYQVGDLEIWNIMQERAGDASPVLPEIGSIMWHGLQITTSAIATAHVEVSQAKASERVRLRNELYERLRTDEVDTQGGRYLASQLGLEPDGRFRVLLVGPQEVGAEDIHSLQSSVDLLRGSGHCIPLGDQMAIVTQAINVADLIERVRVAFPEAGIGIGLERNTLGGAAASLRDAQRALVVCSTNGKPVSRFEDDWIQSLLLLESPTMVPLIEAGIAAASDNPHLVECVRAYANCGFSLSVTARTLHIHANTASYRLERWKQLTGWDPKTFQGLMLSLAAFAYVAVGQSAPPSAFVNTTKGA